MADELVIPVTDSKEEIYKSILPQIKALVESETDLIANLANVSAALKQSLKFLWVGFYLVKGNQLVLGPFQGPIACTRIPFGKGVCGTCYTREQTILVPDVDKFPGHIACSAASKSEIVIPGFKDGKVFLVLDVDSERINYFDQVDKNYLEELIQFLSKYF